MSKYEDTAKITFFSFLALLLIMLLLLIGKVLGNI